MVKPLPPPGKDVAPSPEDLKPGAKEEQRKHKELREQRTKTVKAVKVCPKCGAYMLPVAHFAREGETAGFHNDNTQRSFGGVEVRTFECEKCHYTGQFQVDIFPKELDE
jgi:hypothetical protein